MKFTKPDLDLLVFCIPELIIFCIRFSSAAAIESPPIYEPATPLHR
jgi:hypothetical protein